MKSFEEYKNNEIKENDISTWKYCPVGSVKRKIYDYHNLSLKHFLDIYYNEYLNKSHWDERWLIPIVLPAFENDVEKLSKILGLGVYKNFSHKEMIDFYSLIGNIDCFENDVKLFISWMAGMGFFEKQNISFQDWINTKKFNIGGRHDSEVDVYSLQDIAKEKLGNNLVRDKLIALEWHKR